jgi:hypothetical protein
VNINRILLSSLGLLSLGYSFAADESIPSGLPFLSPNGRYSVELQEIDRLPHFLIKDIETGRVDNSIVMPTVLLYLHWAANSQSIVTVEHIAKGSYGRVIHLKDSKWMDGEIDAPGEEMMDATVIGLEVKADHVHYKFAVDYVKSNGMPFKYKFCNLDVRLDTGKIFNLKWSSINQAEWAASLARKPSYVPPMKERMNGVSH